MRKIIVLLMTSVLATGAVANADTVNVTENPADFMHLDGIFDLDGNAVTQIDVNAIDNGSPVNEYRLNLEVLAANGASPLEQVAVCLYDSNVISSGSLDSECGSGLADPKNSGSAKTAGQNPHSAIHMVFLANPTTPSTPAIVSGAPTIPGVLSQPAYQHYVAVIQDGAIWASEAALEDTLNLQTIGADDVWHIKFRFGPRLLAHHANTWKTRVLATYEDGTSVELVDDSSYQVNFFGAMYTFSNVGNNERGSVDYGDLMAGESSLQTGIQSGAYNANSTVDVTLSASQFSKDSVNLSFGTDGTPGNDQVSLECYATVGGTPVFLQDSTAIDLITDQPANSQPTGDRNAWDQIAAPSHDCELHYGDNAASGTYTNVMTLGVKEAN